MTRELAAAVTIAVVAAAVGITVLVLVAHLLAAGADGLVSWYTGTYFPGVGQLLQGGPGG